MVSRASFLGLALSSLVVVAGCATVAHDDDSAEARGVARSGLLSCDAPSDPNKIFVCHAAQVKWVKISVARSSAHAIGQRHNGSSSPDLEPGSLGLDCECNVRASDDVCAGLPDGSPCDDGNKCTGDGVCKGGMCQAGAPKCAALDVDQCNAMTGACDATTGECVVAPKANGTACNDSNACTTADRCEAGVCVGTAACTIAFAAVADQWAKALNAWRGSYFVVEPYEAAGWDGVLQDAELIAMLKQWYVALEYFRGGHFLVDPSSEADINGDGVLDASEVRAMLIQWWGALENARGSHFLRHPDGYD